MLGIDRKDAKRYLLVALAYLLLSSIMFYPLLLNIKTIAPGAGADTFQSIWELWWVPYALFTLHTTPYMTSYVFYPIGADLVAQTFSPIAGVLSAIFQPVGMTFALNMILLIGFTLSGLFAYLLAYHFTKNTAASFIAGFIFAFSPMHVIQSFGHLQFINIEFIPLFMLFFLKMLEERKHKYAVYSAISFVLLTFMGDVEQGLMAVLLAFFILLYFLLMKIHAHLKDKSKSLLPNTKSLLLIVEMTVAILIIGSPFFIGILSALNKSTLSNVNSQNTLGSILLWSPDVLSFFIPSHYNGLLTAFSNSFAKINSPGPAERTTYIGYTVILLAIIAIFYDYREKFKNTGVVLLPLILFALLSIGPFLQISGYVTAAPGIYLIYNSIPFFNVLREPGRFDIPMELLLGIIAAFGLTKLEAKLGQGIKSYLPVIILILLLIEYNSWPTSKQMFAGMYANATIPKNYSEIGDLKGNFSMLILPAFPGPSELYPGKELYYQTTFKKPLVGGYTTRDNETQVFSLENMPLIASAYYLQNGENLSYGSPVFENYTNTTILLLGIYNVGFVSIIRDAYNETQLNQLTSYLNSFLGSPVIVSNNTIVFSTKNIVSKAGTTITAYTPVIAGAAYSIWEPGWSLCGTSIFCNITYTDYWYALNPSFINIYSPSMKRVNITMQALDRIGFQSEYVYFNTNRNPPSFILNLTPTPRNYSFSVVLNQGINELVFFSPSNSTTNYDFGVKNLTFDK
jgi:hypothetical protein